MRSAMLFGLFAVGLACLSAPVVRAQSLPVLNIDTIVSHLEGDSGITPFVFGVSLSQPSASTVTVNYTTANMTATAPSDYIATSGTLTFAPGQTSQHLTVNVRGDTEVENDESFAVILTATTNATFGKGTGVGEILNDDAAAPPPAVPEPGSVALLVGMGLSGAGFLARRKKARIAA